MSARDVELPPGWLTRDTEAAARRIAEWRKTDPQWSLRTRLALARALAGDGFAVVPVEPTREMTLAANKHVAVVTPDGTWALGRDEAARTYRAMIAAAGEPT